MKPILFDFPNQFETENLLIRLPLPGDGEAVYEAKKASAEELNLWLPFIPTEEEPEKTEANVRDAYAKFMMREDLRLHIFLKHSHQLIGCTGLHRIDWSIPKFEIGYWMDTRWSGRGYMTEAVEGVTKFATETLQAKRVEIRCDTLNKKSKSIPERLGFELEAVLKNDKRDPAGDLRDTCIFVKIWNDEN